MRGRQIEFRFKGLRNYIHGTDIFNLMLEVAGADHVLSNVHFAVHDLIRAALCTLYFTMDKNELRTVGNIAARCQLDINNVTHWLAVTPKDTSAKVAVNRYPYDEEQIVPLCQLSHDTISLNSVSPFSFIETVVAMNKHMHLKLFPEADGKWLFTRLELKEFHNRRDNLLLTSLGYCLV